MKKTVFLFTLLVFGFLGAHAQVNPYAIGVRLGLGNYGNIGEISYQHGFGDANRLELDLGWRGNNSAGYTALTGIYHWVFDISGGFNWYVGPGAQLGFLKASGNESQLGVGLGGQIGLEYDFNEEMATPILLTLDARPMWGFFSSGLGYGASIGVRYTF